MTRPAALSRPATLTRPGSRAVPGAVFPRGRLCRAGPSAAPPPPGRRRCGLVEHPRARR